MSEAQPKTTLNTLEESYQLLLEVLNQMPAGVLCAAMPSGKVLFLNEQTFRIWGRSWTPASTVEDFGSFTDLFSEKHAEPSEWPFVRAMNTGEVIHGAEMEIRRANGSVGIIRVNATRVHDREGKPIAVVTTYYDITDEKRLAEGLEEARRRFAFLADASALLSSSFDCRANLESVANLAVPSFADCCAITLVAAPPIEALVAVAHADVAQGERVRELLRTPGAQLTQQDRLSSAWSFADDRDQVFVRGMGAGSVVQVPIRVRDRIMGVIAFASVREGRYAANDVALVEELARRAAVAVDNDRLYRGVQEANRMKDEFLATVSHELRTPLAAMFMWADLLRQGDLGDEMRTHAIDAINVSARSQAKVIDDLLDVSRIIQGNLRLDLRPVELPGLIAAAIEALSPVAQSKGVRLESAIDAAAGSVIGDAERLRQIVDNLLSNAIKFTPAGGRVAARLERIGASVRLTVEDSGQGIPSDFLPHVFDRFRQADSSSTRRHGGLGLGLAIVHKLVQLHRGSVHAYSEGEGRGATLTVELPVSDVDADARTVAQPPPMPDPEALRGLRVLLVDDQAEALRALSAALTAHGAEVEAVSSAVDALASLASERPDVLVSDIGMPGFDGYALVRRVRAEEAVTGQPALPAVALTAYASSDDRAAALGAGYQTHVPKPVRAADLVAALAAFRGSGSRSE